MNPSVDPGPLRRTVLYAPAHDEAMISSALSLPADVVCLDLEDGVPPDMKPTARERAHRLVTERAFAAREVIVRVNGARDERHAEDIAMCVAASPDGVLLPKTESAEDAARIAQDLAASKALLWCMIESAEGLLAAPAIARASQRITALLIGGFDLAENLRLPFGSGMGSELWDFTTAVVVAARAAGINAIDAISLPSEERRAGFDGRTCAPGQDIVAINRIFSPSDTEIARAHEGVAGAHAYGDHIAAARRILHRAEQIRTREAQLSRV